MLSLNRMDLWVALSSQIYPIDSSAHTLMATIPVMQKRETDIAVANNWLRRRELE